MKVVSSVSVASRPGLIGGPEVDCVGEGDGLCENNQTKCEDSLFVERRASHFDLEFILFFFGAEADSWPKMTITT